jgi:hypothetical protein
MTTSRWRFDIAEAPRPITLFQEQRCGGSMVDGVNRGWALVAPNGEEPTSWVLFQGRGYRVGAIRVPALK